MSTPALDFLGSLKRTHMCGELRSGEAGTRATLLGWVNRRRDLGNLIFIDLRDRTGITQIVFNNELNAALQQRAGTLRSEYVIGITGTVKKRQENTVNKNLPTGEIEVVAETLHILNDAKNPLPFSPAESVQPNEEVRLRYRYLDLRRPEMHANIQLRHKVSLAIRQELSSLGFYEIETPFMTRSTPEGARDYLVPSRVYPGYFYALPQSPQLFKQILMIAGFDKYFQIVRCFRDEDLRADRQPEFTQIDLEMSFPRPDDVFAVVERFLVAAFREAGVELKPPFLRMSYDEAIRKYGIDKPDMRLPEMVDVREAFAEENLNALTLDPRLPVVAVKIPKVGELSRKERDDNKQFFKATGPKLIDDLKRLEKSFPDAAIKIRQKTSATEQDLLVIVGGSPGENRSAIQSRNAAAAVYTAAGQFRLALAQKYKDRHRAFEKNGNADDYRFLWVTDFPMFEWNEGERRWDPAHHPFTSPHEQDMGKLESDPGAVRALAYDIVLNGTELGSGSIRIHRQDIQKTIFRALGMTDEEARARFGFFLEALEYGTPPHGGIALGLDRIVMILAGADSLREVIPFPKTAKARDEMVDAPTPVNPLQLKELGIQIKAQGESAG